MRAPMTDVSTAEYRALRATIATRGTWRAGLALATVVAWALLLIAVLSLPPMPAAALIPLLVLVAGFETIRVLHLGMERIGRYLQVFHERGDGPPAWEHVAMRLGPAVPGAGGHPLFLPVFALATAVNLLAVWLPGPTPVEVLVVGGAHLAAGAWGVIADRAMRRQRRTDLALFETLRDGR